MENKTAMQEMLEWVRKTLPMDLDTPRMIEDKIESLLLKEKEQIKNAYCKGVNDHHLFDEGHKISWENYILEEYGKK